MLWRPSQKRVKRRAGPNGAVFLAERIAEKNSRSDPRRSQKKAPVTRNPALSCVCSGLHASLHFILPT